MSKALLIIDVQEGICHGKYGGFEADRVIANINSVSERMRQIGGLVVVIQHESPSGLLAHGSPSWQLAEGLLTRPADVMIRKTATDSFHDTTLHSILQQHGIKHLIVCGLQSEFCVDTTTRRALTLGYSVTLIADGHTTMDNGVLKAGQISAHHNETLTNITSFGPSVVAVPAAEVRCTN